MNMKFILACFVVVSLLFITACNDDDDMTPYYMTDDPQVLAIRAEPPEVTPGETLSFSMLVSGALVDQEMTNEVTWATGTGFGIGEFRVLGTSPYNQDFVIAPADWSPMLDDIIPGEYTLFGWADLSILAHVIVHGRILSAVKTLRLTTNPIGMNPDITGVKVSYASPGTPGLIESQVADPSNNTININGPFLPENVAFTALYTPLFPGNDKLLFLWKVSFSKNSFGRLWVNADDDVALSLLGPGQESAEYRQSAVFSLRGEEADSDFQIGTYDVYLIVRDKAAIAQSSAEYRYGVDFFCFTLCIGICS